MSPRPEADPSTTQSISPSVILRWKQIATSRENIILGVNILFCFYLFFTSERDSFFGQSNFLNLSRQIAMLAIFAIGEAIVIISGGIDLSVGSIIGVTGMFMGLMLNGFVNRGMIPNIAILVSCVAVLLIALLIGIIQAGFIHFFRLPPFVVTLASLTLLRSVARISNNELPIDLEGFHPLVALGNSSLFHGTIYAIPLPVIIVLPLVILAAWVMKRTRTGRYVYALGGNEEAARLSGISIFKIKAFAYGASGLFAGVAGILYAGYTRQGYADSGSGGELVAITAAVIGGCSLSGGEGSVYGAVIGACLVNIITTAINLSSIPRPSEWQGVIVGIILLFTVIVNSLSRRIFERR